MHTISIVFICIVAAVVLAWPLIQAHRSRARTGAPFFAEWTLPVVLNAPPIGSRSAERRKTTDRITERNFHGRRV